MTIHDAAIPELKNLINCGKKNKNILRLIKNGCSWNPTYKIVLDEQRENDVEYFDKNIKIIADITLESFLKTMNVYCIKTILGTRIIVA